MSDNNLQPIVIALGYFDGLHIGHRTLIKTAREVADNLGATLVVFTFKGNLKATLSGENDSYVCNLEERTKLIYELGADEIYFAPLVFDFLSLGKLAFLNKMNRNYDIKAYVCGEDYRFGKFGEGTVKDLVKYAEPREQRVVVVPTVEIDGKKISTTLIKKLLANGDVKTANQWLTVPYSFTSEVVKGRKVGESLGIPTANFVPEEEKQVLKDGVYKGHAEIFGKVYDAVINYGTRPTFRLKDKVVEAHFIDFDGDVYGQKITLCFDAYMRDIQQFYSTDDLKKQIMADVSSVKDGKYD